MNSRRVLILLLLLTTALCSGQSTNQTKRLSYSDFRLITERNIFNPRRYPHSGPQRAQPATQVDAFTLVGTMTYDKGPFAFFEGTSSAYRKVLKLEDSIAGYKVTNIAFNSVKLANQTNQVELAVGMQMRREENGPWHLAAAPPPALGALGSESVSGSSGAAPTASEAGSAATGTAAASTAGSGSDNDVLRRLMQRREQEMNR